MKKFISLVLAVMMVCTLFTVALAEDPYTSCEGEDVELFHIANVDCATLDDDTNAIHMQYLAQHFVPAEASLSGIRLRLLYGDGKGVMHFELREGGANGKAVFTKDLEFAAQGNVKAWYTFDFGETVTVTPGAKYALSFWLTSKTTGSFCIAVGSYDCREGLDLWRYKRFETDYSGKRFEAENVTLKKTGYTIGFELLTPDKMAAMEVDAMISALPSKITLSHEEAIVNCVTAYGALSEGAKGLVTKLDKLNAAMEALDVLKQQQEENQRLIEDWELQLRAMDPETVTASDEPTVRSLRNEYNGFTKEQKALITSEAIEKLEALEQAVDAVLAGEVEAMIEALPTPTDITFDHVEAILTASLAYEGLTDAQKALVSADAVEKMNQIAAVMEDWGRYKMGDVDADGEVTAKDALVALKVAVQKETLNYIQFMVADIDASDKVDAKDALEMLKFAVEKPSLLDEFYTEVL